MRTAAVFLAGVIIAVAVMAVFSGGGGQVSPSPLPPAMCEGLVKLSVQGTTIVANPPTVCLAVGRPVIWEIVNKGTVTIDFETVGGKRGPFGPTGSATGSVINKDRGIYVAKNDGPSLNVKSLGADDLPRPWKYTVNWVLPNGDTLGPLDPVVCIRR